MSGFAAGGAADALNQGLDRALRQQTADATNARANIQIGLAQKGLELRQQQLADAQGRNTQSQVNKHIADVTRLVTQIIKNSPNAPRDKLMNTINPLLDDIDAWGARVGQDTSKLRAGFVQLVQQPSSAPLKVGQTLEQIKADLASGKKLTPSQQRLYDDSIHSDFLNSLLKPDQGGDMGGGLPTETPAPAGAAPASATTTLAPPTPVKTQTISAPGPAPTPGAAGGAPAAAASTPVAAGSAAPPIPPGLAGIPGILWAPSTGKFYTPDGMKAWQPDGTPVNP